MHDKSTPAPSFPQSRTCPTCGKPFPLGKRRNQRYCSRKCRWTDKNRRRTLPPPNVFYSCVVCGMAVARYVTPSQQKTDALRYCSRACKGKDLSGERHPGWKGGRHVNDQGYVMIHQPDHPFADHKGYVREHRLVMEQEIGRLLTPEEVVHHDDDDTQNNDPGNLPLFPNQAAHNQYEMQRRLRDRRGRLMPKVG